MTDTRALEFDGDSKLGKVASVDTGKVLIDVDNSTLLTRVGVGHLVAIQGPTAAEYLIGITDRVTRSISEGLEENPVDRLDRC